MSYQGEKYLYILEAYTEDCKSFRIFYFKNPVYFMDIMVLRMTIYEMKEVNKKAQPQS